MVAIVYAEDFGLNLARGVFNLETDTIRLAFSNTAPASEANDPRQSGNGVLANVTQTSYANLTGGQPTLDNIVVAQVDNVTTMDADAEVLAAAGGDVATFRYVYLYSDTPTSPADPIIGVYDTGAAQDITDGNNITMNIPTVLVSVTTPAV